MKRFQVANHLEERVSKWWAEHQKFEMYSYYDADHTLTWHFTETGIGLHIEVTCTCGARLDITEYEKW